MIDKNVLHRTAYIKSFCDQLTHWVTSEKDISFFSKSKNGSENRCGDIIPTKSSVNWLKKIHFTIKYGYKNATFDKHFIPNPNDVMYNLWKTAVTKAGDDRLPVLIFKKTNMPCTYIFIPYELYQPLTSELINCNMLRVRYSDMSYAYVFELNEFLDNVKYKKLKKVVNNL